MVTRLLDAAVVMVAALFTLRYGILTMDAIRRFNSSAAIVEDVELWFVTDVAVMGIWLSTISPRSREILLPCLSKHESALALVDRSVHVQTIRDSRRQELIPTLVAVLTWSMVTHVDMVLLLMDYNQ